MEGKVKCLCLAPSQKRVAGGRTRLYNKGDIEYFAKCPRINWRQLTKTESAQHDLGNETKLIFDDMTDSELFDTPFEAHELREYMAERYPDVQIHHQLGLKKMIALFIIARNERLEQEFRDSQVPNTDPLANEAMGTGGEVKVKDGINIEVSEEQIAAAAEAGVESTDESQDVDINLDDLDIE